MDAKQLTPREIMRRPHLAALSGDGSCVIVEPVKLVPIRGASNIWWNRRIYAHERQQGA